MNYNKSKKKITLSFIFVMLIISLSFSILYYIWGLVMPVIHHLIISVFSLYIFIVVWNYKANFDFVHLIQIALYPYIAIYFISNMIFWEVMPINIIWGAAFPLGSLFLHNIKKTINVSIFTFASIILAPFISNIFGLSDTMSLAFKILSKDQLFILNYIDIIFFIMVIIIIIYQFYLHNEEYIEHRINEKNQINEPEAVVFYDELESDYQESVYDIKLNRIYESMVKHIEMEKSYTNPDFRLEDLAKIVGTNRSYASAALNKKGKTFNNFINWYRVEHVKRELQDNKKRMKEIYTEAGFRYHSTFVKVFEETVGVKPSKYQYIQKEPE
ncbi:helix-turn-helix domain-containing protein [Chryseobacterium gleum]|uniref:helix-turn-helix domain-containing protein n=1 Tax=Chryseobacterium gleum TaxID=250 RepID=UPI001E43D9DF|nr:helix-turn-helix transcriptional regulator [Chryseobacterium gleum]MCD9617542.1 helix-turn-helix transcriptional regulator [Chryseobacterium gleum]